MFGLCGFANVFSPMRNNIQNLMFLGQNLWMLVGILIAHFRHAPLLFPSAHRRGDGQFQYAGGGASGRRGLRRRHGEDHCRPDHQRLCPAQLRHRPVREIQVTGESGEYSPADDPGGGAPDPLRP